MPWQVDRSDGRVDVAGDLRLADASAIWRRLCAVTAHVERELVFDLARATAIDGAIMSLIVERRAALVARGVRCSIAGAPDRLARVVHLYRGDEPPVSRPPADHDGAIARLGAATLSGLRRVRALVTFGGEVVAAIGSTVRHPSATNWRALPALIERAGADGVPIVVILNFLVGFVGAFQSTVQLRQFGANIYVADIIGVSVTRELAPLITAIIIAGRSGAGFAAELGTMRVSEEIDALRTMGFAPQTYLVLPRVLALAIVAPILTLLGDVAGVTGGLVVGATSLDITPNGFIAELRTIVVVSDVWTGLVKSVAFGIAIALIGCQHGLGARGAASGVGRGTTATVVYCLFMIVILDTLFTMLFRGLGL